MTDNSTLPRPQTYKPKERLEGRYHAQDPQDVRWFEKLLDKLENWTGPAESFNGSFTLNSAPHFRPSPAEYSDWRSQTTGNWQRLVEADARLSNNDRASSIRYHLNRAELILELSSHNSTELTEMFQTLQKELPIVPLETSPRLESKGERRRYFATEPIDPAWFERASELVGSIGKHNLSFDGRFRLASTGREFSRPNFEEWRDGVRKHWDDLASIYCWVYSPQTKLMMDVDLLRDLVSLELQARDEEAMLKHLNALEMELKLVKAEENPYRYRRFLRAYKIKRWTSNEKFAEALKAAVEFAFPGRIVSRRVAMPTAYVTVGDTEEDLDPFSSYDLFLQRIASPQEFTKCELVLEGPRGRSLGVLLNRQTKRLTVRTSLERADLDSLTRPFRNAMELTLEEARDEEKEKEEKPKITKVMVATAALSILAALWSGAVAIFTSQRGLTPFRNQYVLEITHPVGESGKAVDVSERNVRIEWRLTKKDLMGDHPDLRSAALIEVVPDANPKEAQTYTGTGGSLVIPFTPGSHYVRVVSQVDPNSAAAVKVTVPKPEDANQTTPAKSTGNGTANRKRAPGASQ